MTTDTINSFAISTTAESGTITATHSKHGHAYRFYKLPDPPYFSSAGCDENGLAERGPDGFIGEASNAVDIFLKKTRE